jgi:hypothetical protein
MALTRRRAYSTTDADDAGSWRVTTALSGQSAITER